MFEFQVIDWANSTDAVTYFLEGMIPVNEFITFCTFAGQPVDCADIVTVVPTLDGFCYKVSSEKFPGEVFFNRAGHRFGLSFQVDVQEWSYDGMAFSAGVGAQVGVEIFPIEYLLLNDWSQ